MGEMALYRGAGQHPDKQRPQGNVGLWYSKFYSGFDLAQLSAIAQGKDSERGKGKSTSEKADWLKKLEGASVGDRAQMNEYAGRRRLMVDTMRGALVYVKNEVRFVTGLGLAHPAENGFMWHPVLGSPYLPGSGVKGVVKAWAEAERLDAGLCEAIFGAEERAGQIAFLDAVPVAPVVLAVDAMTPHYGPYYQNVEIPGDWHSPVPIPFLTVAPGCMLQCAVIARPRQDEMDGKPWALDNAEMRKLIETAVEWLTRAFGELGAGAKTAVGYGRFALVDGSQVGADWVKGLDARREAALPLEERMRREVAKMTEQEAIDCLRVRIGKQGESNPEIREALRLALHARFHQAWSTDDIGRIGPKKQKEYLSWLRGEAAAPTAPAAPQDSKKKKPRREKNRPKRT